MKKKSRVPTRRQQETLDFMRKEYTRTGLAPTLKEICRHLGIKGQNAVVGFLKQLELKGHVRLIVRSRGPNKYLPAVGENCCPCCGRPR